MKIEHIAIYVKDLEASRSFYERFFRAQSNARYHTPAKGFSSYFLRFDEGCRLEIMQRTDIDKKKGNAPEETPGLTHFAVSVGSKAAVDELTERIRAAGFRVLGEPRTTGDGYYESVIADPEGNRIEITV